MVAMSLSPIASNRTMKANSVIPATTEGEEVVSTDFKTADPEAANDNHYGSQSGNQPRNLSATLSTVSERRSNMPSLTQVQPVHRMHLSPNQPEVFSSDLRL